MVKKKRGADAKIHFRLICNLGEEEDPPLRIDDTPHLSILAMDLQTPSLRFSYYGLSDIGLHRENNEDVWDSLPDSHFFVLADGMGGHRAGDVAAKEAVQALCRKIQGRQGMNCSSPLETLAFLRKALTYANEVVFQLSRAHDSYTGMGTTICCLYFDSSFVFYGHVGDSRIYRLRGDVLQQMTRDHSLLSDLLRKGILKKEQAARFHYRNIITKAVGTDPIVEPSVDYHRCLSHDRYLLCSDGLTDLLSFSDLSSILLSSRTHGVPLQKSVEQLIELAKKKGGHDNITALLIAAE